MLASIYSIEVDDQFELAAVTREIAAGSVVDRRRVSPDTNASSVWRELHDSKPTVSAILVGLIIRDKRMDRIAVEGIDTPSFAAVYRHMGAQQHEQVRVSFQCVVDLCALPTELSGIARIDHMMRRNKRIPVRVSAQYRVRPGEHLGRRLASVLEMNDDEIQLPGTEEFEVVVVVVPVVAAVIRSVRESVNS